MSNLYALRYVKGYKSTSWIPGATKGNYVAKKYSSLGFPTKDLSKAWMSPNLTAVKAQRTYLNSGRAGEVEIIEVVLTPKKLV